MNTATSTPDATPDELRAAMVDRLAISGAVLTGAVEDAMRTVPRHLFVPDATPGKAYAEQAVITKRAPDGTSLSCASGPGIVAMMLEALIVLPGQRILEIGAGTGYNSALLAHLTGPGGHVTTIDIDPDVTSGASAALAAAGVEAVTVLTGDGVFGDPDGHVHDRLIATVGVWDISSAWWDQLTPGGRLVLPLRWRGQTRAVAFRRDSDRMISESVELCGFVPMIGQEGERTAPIHPGDLVALHWDQDQAINPDALTGVLTRKRTIALSGIEVGPYDPFDGIWLRLTATEPGCCRIAATPEAVKSALCAPAIPQRSPALIEGDSLAYLSLARNHAAPGRHMLGVIGHGPNRHDLADRLIEGIHTWNSDRAAIPTVTAYRGLAGLTPQASGLIRKPDSPLTITF
ncbi:methyltransferase, FxLD system [Parafrankia sp. BMG5.11]|uniref:methyltransferase, FxLD system n=1 Tax=Parafrankia sp. BMG5.11 TaxID=222540 RepID=UPI00103DEA81|nr:methyltransferase, FxLD system [Parafrankia sp. BMG5.11]TCJ34569.1 methyltransferase, FxLD system [Parafrankia sp. BMG5.11]